MVLNRKAFVKGDNGNPNSIFINSDTWKTISKIGKRDVDPATLHPTKFAIADNFCIGRNEEVDDLSCVEAQCYCRSAIQN